MTLARKVADYGHEQSPLLVADFDIAGIDIFATPVEWDLELGHNYKVYLSDLRAWASLATTMNLVLNYGNSGGIINGVNDYRWGGVRASTSGLANVDNWVGTPSFDLVSCINDGGGTGQTATIDVLTATLASRESGYQTVQRSYRFDANGNSTEFFTGWLFDAGTTLTKAYIRSSISNAMAAGRIQVFRLPKLGP